LTAFETDTAGTREHRVASAHGVDASLNSYVVRAAPRTPPLVSITRGRDPELGALGEQLSRVQAGAGAVILVEGGAGMGKTRLLDEAAAMASRMSFKVGLGAADPGDSVVELAPLLGALSEGPEPPFERAKLRDLPLRAEQRYWLHQDLQTLLERSALQTPLLLCIDDLQWADGATAAALRTLLPRLAAVPIAWAIAYRPVEGSDRLLNAVGQLERAATRIVLGPLEEPAIAQVAKDAMQAEPDDALLEMAAQAHGSPFVLTELLTGLREEHLVRIASGRAELLEDRPPHRVSESMRKRLTRLSEPSRRAATVAASLGRRFSFTELAAMLQSPPWALLEPVQGLIDADLLAQTDDQLAFRHDLTRDAVRDSIPVSARRAIDRQAADVLLAAGALPVEVAVQLAASAEPGDELAISTLLRAAETLSASEPRAGAELARRALDLAPPKHPLRGPLVTQTALLMHAAGQGEEAKAFADTALREALPAEQEAEVRLGMASMFGISPDLRADAGRRALALPEISPALRARHLARLAHNLLVGGRFHEARAALPDARAAVCASEDSRAWFTMQLVDGGFEHVDGRYQRSLEIVEDAMRSGLDGSEDQREGIVRQWARGAIRALDRIEEALELANDGVSAAERDRQGWALHLAEVWRGTDLLMLGRLRDAQAALQGLFSAEDAHLVVGLGDAEGVVALGRIAIHVGDARQARETAEIAHVMLAGGTPGVRRHAAWLLALQAMGDGDPTGARAWLCALGSEERKSILPRLAVDVTDEIQLVRIAVAADDSELAQSGLAAAECRAELNPDIATIIATAAHVRGLLGGDPDELASAVELFKGSPRRLALAAALEDLGVSQVDRGARGLAIEALGEALEHYAAAGAIVDTARLRSRLRELGVRRRLVSTGRPDTSWTALTETELAVARLVAEGLTNRDTAERLFISPHTVSTHLRHVFAKLGINSRVELTRLAGEHEQPSSVGARSSALTP
jgi:DNA-binding CsgD family transcriptional regulator